MDFVTILRHVPRPITGMIGVLVHIDLFGV